MFRFSLSLFLFLFPLLLPQAKPKQSVLSGVESLPHIVGPQGMVRFQLQGMIEQQIVQGSALDDDDDDFDDDAEDKNHYHKGTRGRREREKREEREERMYEKS